MQEMNAAEEDIRRAYHEVARDKQVRFAMVAAALGLILVPAGISLDYFVYPDHLWQFFLIRSVCDFFIASFSVFYFFPIGKKYFRLITFANLFAVSVAMCVMIYLTDGGGSLYYAGLHLNILAAGVVLPLTVAENVAVDISTILMYLVAVFAHGFNGVSFSVFYNNLYFLSVTSVISITASVFHEKRRFSEYKFSYELGSKNKELAELDRLKSEFFANISHELRTPLTLIIAPLQDILQRSDRLPDRIAGPLRIVCDNALRLLKLVNDLLDVIRLEEGKTQLEEATVKMNSLLSGVADAMTHLAESREVDLRKDIADQPMYVVGDRHAFEKIFFNLLSNALKFTPAGGTITVFCRPERDTVRIEVRDTGIGISDKDLPYVFDRFRQADSSTTRRYQGTGLGLALVRELTERQGGHVEARSKTGRGTTMMVSFPLQRGGAAEIAQSECLPDGDPLERMYLAAEQTAALPLAAPPGAEAELATADALGTVLVVDDEPDMRRYLVETLATEYEVIQAADGRTGLELARRKLPDLMVLDLMLPEMDGLEVCSAIKEDPRARGVKLILLTARADEATKLEALERGADDFLTKPFSSTEVKTRLRNMLQASRLERDLQQRNTALEQALKDLRRAEGQLIQSEKLNALGSLAAGLLHEINNPLNYAMTALQIAKTDPSVSGDEDLLDIFGDIDEGMQRIRNIVTDLRAFAYPSKDEQQPFEFEEALQSALQFTAHELRGISVGRTLDENGLVQGSRSHIVQVLVNLFTNASKAIAAVGEARPGEIQVITEHRDGRLSVLVKDNGVGIDPEVLGRIFDPFYTTRDVGEGMGLGLSICHTIIKNHGGTLTARSEPGQWTEFAFDLPLAETSSS